MTKAQKVNARKTLMRLAEAAAMRGDNAEAERLFAPLGISYVPASALVSS